LPKALTAEQNAYQALLSLSAREYQVTRNRSRSNGGGGGGQRNQGQLDNLDLKDEKDRYETQRQAGPQQKPEQREQLAVLSRLKELAQRQQDLNERLKDLQTALREAKTEEQRKELERELKRLRDEQREMLADMDELAQRMERNQSQMSESRQQLDQTRSHVQNAAEALDKESVSQALSEGTRAQRDLQQLRDDFRKKNSNQFAEDMREMRQTARDLAEKQEEISSKIDAEANQKQKTLTASEEAKGLAEKFAQQKTGFTNLVRNMREVSDKAEAAEPMLSRQLYEAVRKTAQGNVENNLSASEELLKRSFLSEAGQFSRRTQQDLNELKRSVEEAASGVLGDEAEALKFAKNELDDLVNKLSRELERSAQGGTGTNGAQLAQNQSGGARQAQSQTNGAQQAKSQGNAETPGNQTGSKNAETAQNGNEQRGEQQAASAGERSGNSQNNSQSPQGSQGESTAAGQQRDQQANQTGQQGGEQPGQNGQQNRAASRGQRGQGDRKQNDGNQGGRFDPGRWTQNEQGGADGGGAGGPMYGGEFREWSERLGQVEELMDQPDLRTQAGRIRDRARALRAEFKRHANEPQWDLVRNQVYGPLTELRNRVAEELARVQSTESLVPIDRDPVPNKFSDLVRRYYEKLGDSQTAPKAQ
jgi:DNA repair exonuclease SbcCD ATPase subunit